MRHFNKEFKPEYNAFLILDERIKELSIKMEERASAFRWEQTEGEAYLKALTIARDSLKWDKETA